MRQHLRNAFIASGLLIAGSQLPGCGKSETEEAPDTQITQHESHEGHNHDTPPAATPQGNSQAEARAEIAPGMWVAIDIDLLGPNGELTVGFIKSISPVQCHALQTRGLDMNSTDSGDIQIAVAHILTHRAQAERVAKICDDAQALWHATRGNKPEAPAPGGP